MGTNLQILPAWIDVALASSGNTPEVKVRAQVPNGEIKPSPTEPRHDRATLESRDQTQLFPTPSVPIYGHSHHGWLEASKWPSRVGTSVSSFSPLSLPAVSTAAPCRRHVVVSLLLSARAVRKQAKLKEGPNKF